jgi:hypothetical protein
MRKLLLSLATLAFVGIGCGRGAADSFRDGFPARELVELQVPGGSSQALSGEGQRQQALQGDRAEFYVLTRAATVTVNGGVLAVLGLVKAITNRPPTQLSGNQATWGPHTEPLSPNTWKFTVTEVAPKQYTYQLEGKAKQDPDAAFVVVLSGAHSPALDESGEPLARFGAGSFTLDFDAAQTLPEHDRHVGKVEVAYARAAPGSNGTVDATFTQVKDLDSGRLVDGVYKYVRKPGAGGEFQFFMDRNIHGGAALESLSIKSRWEETGAGRSDVKAQGGDLASPATASQCWDQLFRSQFLVTSYDASLNYGDEATGCVFSPAQFASP